MISLIGPYPALLTSCGSPFTGQWCLKELAAPLYDLA